MTRIVSLVPSATEIVFALGAGDEVVGVSHECDHPPSARRLPQLTAARLPPGRSPAAVDRFVSRQLADGGSLYRLDATRLADLAPDLILSQDLCPVCAVSPRQVEDAIESLDGCPEVVYLDPQNLAEVFTDIRRVAARLGRPAAADELLARLEQRLRAVADFVADRPRPRVVALEWLDPPFVGGHWVPEMIARSGGVDALARAGDPSRRTPWEAIAEADPDWIVAMPCGFDRDGAREQVERLVADPGVPPLRALREGRIAAVDANGCFSRPGPRLVDGIEELAAILHGFAPAAADRPSDGLRVGDRTACGPAQRGRARRLQ